MRTKFYPMIFFHVRVASQSPEIEFISSTRTDECEHTNRKEDVRDNMGEDHSTQEPVPKKSRCKGHPNSVLESIHLNSGRDPTIDNRDGGKTRAIGYDECEEREERRSGKKRRSDELGMTENVSCDSDSDVRIHDKDGNRNRKKNRRRKKSDVELDNKSQGVNDPGGYDLKKFIEDDSYYFHNTSRVESQKDNEQYTRTHTQKFESPQRGSSPAQHPKSSAEIALDSASAKSTYMKRRVDSDKKTKNTYGSNNRIDRNEELRKKKSQKHDIYNSSPRRSERRKKQKEKEVVDEIIELSSDDSDSGDDEGGMAITPHAENDDGLVDTDDYEYSSSDAVSWSFLFLC